MMAEFGTDTAASIRSCILVSTVANSKELEKWTCEALKAHLKSWGLSHLDFRKAELVAK